MSSVKYTSLINNGYRYQEIASNHILLTSSTGYSSIAPDVDGAVLMSTGIGWSMSTDITTDTELSAYSNSLKIYIDTYTSDSELKDYSNSAAANLESYSNQVSIALQNLNNNFNNYYDKTQINNSVAACVQTTDYNSDLTNLIYTTSGLTSPSILTYQNGKSTLNLPTGNGNYMLNKSGDNYSFTEYIGNDESSLEITPQNSTSLSINSISHSIFNTGYIGNYLIAGTIDIYIDDITLLTPPEDSTALDYEWIDKLPIIYISVNNTQFYKYVVKQNQPLQTIPINIIAYLPNNITTSLAITCGVTTSTDGPALQPSNIFIRPVKDNITILKL